MLTGRLEWLTVRVVFSDNFCAIAVGSTTNSSGRILSMARKWTVMVCLAGDNNLSSEMIYAIKEMKRVEKVGPHGDVTAIVLFDPSEGLPTQSYVINSDSPGDVDDQLRKEARLIGSVKKNGKRGIVREF